jgi:hypothetical protein
MKHQFLLSQVLLFSVCSFGQLTFDHTLVIEDYSNYDNRCVIGFLPDHDYVIYQHEYVSEWDNQAQASSLVTSKIKIYDFSYSLVKEIDIISLGNCSLMGFNEFDKKFNIGVTQYLFNQDALIEFVVTKDSKIQVYNENLSLVQEFESATNNLGEEMQLIRLNDAPEYKLKVGQYNEFQFYSVAGDPFQAPGATQTSVLKSGKDFISVFPNPTTGIFTVRFTKEITGNLTVIDMNGRCVKRSVIAEPVLEHKVDLTGLSAGTYFCQVNSDENDVQTVKVIKHD